MTHQTGNDAVDEQKPAEDEHVRWPLFLRAIDELDLDRLVALVRAEPDVAMATSAVVKVPPAVGAVAGRRLLEAVDGHVADFAAQRLAEVEVFERVEAGADALDEAQVREMGRWLQQRLADRSERRGVLEAVHTWGSSRRIRDVARQRLGSATRS